MKIPLAYTLGNRQVSLDQDALMRNAMAEITEAEQRIRARKRPSIIGAYTAAAGTGQALFTWNIPGPLAPTQQLVAITDDTINTGPTVVVNSLIFTVQPN